MSQLDQYYRRLILGTVFYEGWGAFKDLLKWVMDPYQVSLLGCFIFWLLLCLRVVRSRRKYVSTRKACLDLVNENHPIEIEKVSISCLKWPSILFQSVHSSFLIFQHKGIFSKWLHHSTWWLQGAFFGCFTKHCNRGGQTSQLVLVSLLDRSQQFDL